CEELHSTTKKQLCLDCLRYTLQEMLKKNMYGQNFIVHMITESIINLNTENILAIPNIEKLNQINFRLINKNCILNVSNSDENADPQDKLAPAHLYLTLLSQSLPISDTLETLFFNKKQKKLTLIIEDIEQQKLITVLEKCELLLRNYKNIIPKLESYLQNFATQFSAQKFGEEKIDQNTLILALTQEIIKYSPKKPNTENPSFLAKLFGCGRGENAAFGTMNFSDQN
ncbi:MAG: hypothetical protein ABH827_05980, partial [bacterium]